MSGPGSVHGPPTLAVPHESVSVRENWSRAMSMPGLLSPVAVTARLSENSELLPFVSVAVAVTKSPGVRPATEAVNVPPEFFARTSCRPSPP